ncbi:ATP-grasp domain-containing protein [Saccharibacillus sacchari]|uniref:ATP-grasp domain-containing protein n=1 Tax=Saccharibacillus sacchari TaxID=456493 RepID=A0ACC6PBZ6_9BACL
MTFTVLFVSAPMSPKEVDDSYADEYRSAAEAGFDTGLIHLETLLLDRDPRKAVKRIAERSELQSALYRGWMLRPSEYEDLYAALLKRNLRLIHTPEQYRHTHHLPESYAKIEQVTPKSIWFPLPDPVSMEAAESLSVEAVRLFENKPVIVKDYVKSRKHEWDEACYIPDALDEQRVRRTVRRFLELQGSELNEGLVFRAFAELEVLSRHPLSGMPLSREIRVFVLDGQPVFVSTYWEAGEDEEFNAALQQFLPVIQTIESRFFTIDFAKTRSGPWIVLELGDGQTAGLPDDTDTDSFYRQLAQGLNIGGQETERGADDESKPQ